MTCRRSESCLRRALAVLTLVWLCVCPLTASGVPPEDAYVAGYVAAVLERQLGVSPHSVRVKNGVVTIDAVDLPRGVRPRVVTALSAIPGVAGVEIPEVSGPAPAAPAEAPRDVAPAAEASAIGLLPSGHLFRPLIADPRWPHFSAAYRHDFSGPVSRNVVAVSFGETVPLYRDNVDTRGRWGQWEAGVQGGVFSIFDIDSSSFDLVNTDFFVAGFLGYRSGDFSAFGRVFHQSSHLGDELLLRDTRPNRINLSYEGFDAKLSYDLPAGIRAYAGGGYLVDVQPSNLGRGLVQLGGEWRSPWPLWRGRLRPIAGLDLQFREENSWHTDVSVRGGLQFESVSVLSRNLQILIEYFNGHSFDGQFYREPVEYVGLGLHFNF